MTGVVSAGTQTDADCSGSVDASSGSARRLLHWFLVFTKPAGEALAQENLLRQGYRVYYPRLLRPIFHRGKWIERIVSLFPRYLFIQVDPLEQSLSPVRSTQGVASIVRFGPEATVVPNAIVSDLLRRADPLSGLHRLARVPEALKAGSPVNIIAGAFEGLNGIFEREVGEERVVVLLKLLGQCTPVRLPSQYIAPVVA